MPYKLSATLTGHTSDARLACVRALSTPADDLILSASRDSTAIVWRRDSAASSFTSDSVFHASTRYVNAVTYLPPTPDAPKGYAVTGDQDGVINVYSLEPTKDDPDYTLLGHTNNVCGLRTTPTGNIISCSWDSTARVWKNFNSAVWDVLAINEDEFITASADKTIKLWQQHKVIHTFGGHNGVVRSLALIPDIGFASCADNEIRVWSLGGDLVYTLTGHTSFIYRLAVLPSGDLVSSSEDRSVRVWKDGECAQVLVHPAISVWTVSTLPNGDIVSGASDKIVRIFSASEDRWAPAEEIKAYEDVIAQQSLASHDVDQVKIDTVEALSNPGTKVGQTKLVLNGDITEVHHWDGSVWEKIGERVEGSSSEKTKTFFEGKEYDYVWNVAIEDGEPSLKLPYNVAENPAAAAQRFLERNNLPLTHINTVVEYIYQNTPGQTLGTGGGEQYVDPFTGERTRSQRVASGSSGSAAPASSYMDPYTGASRYTGTPTPAAAAPSSSYMDPYTGASRYSGASQPAAAPAKPAGILPMLQPVLLKEGNLVQMRAKLHQYNADLGHEISTSALAFYPEEDRSVDDAFAYVQKCAAGKRPTNPLGTVHIDSVIQVLERWPVSLRLPVSLTNNASLQVLDLARLIIAFCPEAVKAPGLKERLFECLFKAADWKTPWAKAASKPGEMNIMLVFRALANVAQEGSGAADGPWLGQILKVVSDAPYAALSGAQRKPLATMLLNVSCVTLFTPLDAESRALHVSMIFRVFEEEKTDSESVYRALVGLGNVIYASKQQNSPLGGAQAAQVTRSMRDLPTRFPEDRIRNIVVEISALLVSGIL
ncbi:Phospholipase A-2-activating protein [Mycena sanguinolenta]|uniref:Phospholipase A-2-activating protein n=1 Tax=Mycena sanguinolenta TaxID=230812 RepID=A0A8H7D9S3_9AGAR|nr:Phospholipase A-2-activating protein [Mycena sanguinolenta]